MDSEKFAFLCHANFYPLKCFYFYLQVSDLGGGFAEEKAAPQQNSTGKKERHSRTLQKVIENSIYTMELHR